MSHIFEGSEKKLEIVLKEGAPSLRLWPESEWIEVIEAAGAQVLSKTSNDYCDAYLLSESSLFVWDESLVLITCGTTTLGKAAELLANRIPLDQREAFFFQRKNEYFPHLQKSHFEEDVSQLEKVIPGHAHRLGEEDGHYLCLYHNEGNIKSDRLGCTLEVLMYDLQGATNEAFNCENSNVVEIRAKTQVDKILPGFQVDDYCFSPKGYSLNAIKDEQYYTIHVTPQDESPYVSFETNVAQSGEVKKALLSILETFRPQNVDVVFFDGEGRDELIDLSGYELKSSGRHSISDSYKVQFAHFSQEGSNV